MSHDVYFVAESMRGRWDEAMQRIEAETVAGTAEWTDDLDAEWKSIVRAARAAVPSIEVTDRRLSHPTSHVELVGYPGQITMTVSLSSGPIKETVSALTEIARAVESCADLVA